MKKYILLSLIAFFASWFIGINVTFAADVNWNDVRQVIDGFGATTWWGPTYSSSMNNLFFDVNSGIGLSFIRTQILPTNEGIESDDVNNVVAAVAKGARAWASPWSPPGAYKSSGDPNQPGYLLPNYYQDYANYLANYAYTMKHTYGVDLYAISVQNEPDISLTGSYTCTWTAQQIHDFIPFLYSALNNYSMSSVKIIIPEYSTWDTVSRAETTMDDPSTATQVGIIAAHSYLVNNPGVLNSWGKPLWETEDSNFTNYSNPDHTISDALTWAVKIHQTLTVANVSAWHYFELYNWYDTSDAGLTDQSGAPAKRMYALGQYSKFIRPGYYRIGTTDSNGVLVSAYKEITSGKFAIVSVNTNSSPTAVTYSLNGFNPSSVTPWITSDTLSLAQQSSVSVSGSSFAYTLPASSIITFAGQANSSPAPTPTPTPTPTPICSGSCTNGETCSSCPSDCGVCPTPLPLPVGNWVKVADENGTCSFNGTQDVWYGAANSYFHKTMPSGTLCSNTTFGGDPLYGTAKACYINIPPVDTTPPAAPTGVTIN